jgi:serine/threonine protein kinase
VFEDHHRFSSKSDVWAYGVTLYEIWTAGAKPYAGLGNDDVIYAVCRRNQRLALPTTASVPRAVMGAFAKCMVTDPEARASGEELLHVLGPAVTASGLGAEGGLVQNALPVDRSLATDTGGYLLPSAPAATAASPPTLVLADSRTSRLSSLMRSRGPSAAEPDAGLGTLEEADSSSTDAVDAYDSGSAPSVFSPSDVYARFRAIAELEADPGYSFPSSAPIVLA